MEYEGESLFEKIENNRIFYTEIDDKLSKLSKFF